MTQYQPFFKSTLQFFSLTPDYKQALNDELLGCVKHIGIDYNSVYNMPIHRRKYFIAKHNKEIDNKNKEIEKSNRNRRTLYPS